MAKPGFALTVGLSLGVLSWKIPQRLPLSQVTWAFLCLSMGGGWGTLRAIP